MNVEKVLKLAEKLTKTTLKRENEKIIKKIKKYLLIHKKQIEDLKNKNKSLEDRISEISSEKLKIKSRSEIRLNRTPEKESRNQNIK